MNEYTYLLLILPHILIFLAKQSNSKYFHSKWLVLTFDMSHTRFSEELLRHFFKHFWYEKNATHILVSEFIQPVAILLVTYILTKPKDITV
jgi:hypothetical protein